MLNGKFGNRRKIYSIEEFLRGEEMSFFIIFSDGNSVCKVFGTAQDHKRAF